MFLFKALGKGMTYKWKIVFSSINLRPVKSRCTASEYCVGVHDNGRMFFAVLPSNGDSPIPVPRAAWPS